MTNGGRQGAGGWRNTPEGSRGPLLLRPSLGGIWAARRTPRRRPPGGMPGRGRQRPARLVGRVSVPEFVGPGSASRPATRTRGHADVVESHRPGT